jgi:hypothetical protein
MIIPAEYHQENFKSHILLARFTVWTREMKKSRMIREIMIFNKETAPL